MLHPVRGTRSPPPVEVEDIVHRVINNRFCKGKCSQYKENTLFLTKLSKKSLTYIYHCPIIVNVVIEPTTEYRGIAKLVRHWILNPAFVGSSPATPAIEY